VKDNQFELTIGVINNKKFNTELHIYVETMQRNSISKI